MNASSVKKEEQATPTGRRYKSVADLIKGEGVPHEVGKQVNALASETGIVAQTALNRPLVYLAGPDVFYPDPLAVAVRKKNILSEMGMAGLFPLDNEISATGEPPECTALRIALANEALIQKSDIVLANMEPWHGPSMDVGMAYEMGYGRALGKIVVGYAPDRRPFAERVKAFLEHQKRLHPGCERFQIEDFGQMADNLMLVNAIVGQRRPVEIPATFEEAAALAKKLWEEKCAL